MKGQVKKILKTLGIYKSLYRYYLSRERAKFSDLTYCHMDFKGLILKFNTKDAYSKSWFYPRFGKGLVHEPATTELFINLVEENSNVFDIGGHLGYFACVAGKLSNKGKICVFEMDSKCIHLIKENLELNNLENVKTYNVALSDSKGSVSIPNLEVPDPGIRIDFEDKVKSTLVDSITIDEFVKKENIIPDFIKIDVEGAEYKVLKGMLNTLKKDSLILLIEIHVSQLLKYYKTDYKEILKLLFDYGFVIEKIESHRSNKLKLSKVKPTSDLKGNIMILCRKHQISIFSY